MSFELRRLSIYLPLLCQVATLLLRTCDSLRQAMDFNVLSSVDVFIIVK